RRATASACPEGSENPVCSSMLVTALTNLGSAAESTRQAKHNEWSAPGMARIGSHPPGG
ncbi:hypothetical protein GTG23_30985, partial [Rhodococcus hoagii]|nr:hypothetical protein [Prescottella equi]